MVRGRGIGVTAVALMYQCAETTRIARGRATDAPNARHASVKRLESRGFIGLPWPGTAAGIAGAGAVSVTAPSSPSGSGRVASTPRWVDGWIREQRREEPVDPGRGDRHQLLERRHRRTRARAFGGDEVDGLLLAQRRERGIERDQAVHELQRQARPR